MIEIILRSLMIVVYVDRPAAQRDGEPELVFLIALAFERNESESLRDREIEQRATDGGERRRLVVSAPETRAQYPMQIGNAY